MSRKVEVKVNVINQLRLLRNSTFKDVFCFLDEDIQNAQRAKAKNVHIYLKSDKIIIENDGIILDNPQSLFSIAESGWDNEIKEAENPFGMGFFSNITVSNLIEIFSGKQHIVFDVEKMINTNDTTIFVEEIEDNFQGFRLILNNFDYNMANRYDIRERISLLGKYIQELNIYCDGMLQEKRDLTEGDDSEFQLKIEEEDFKGWIALAGNFWYSDNLNIFYKGRLVKKLENFPYIKGDIHISDKAINLTSPDRKDVIKDEKYRTFRENILEYIKLLCEEAILDGEESDIENFANGIGYYIDKKQVKNKIRFLTLKAQKEEDLKYIKKIALVKKENKKISSYKDFQLYLKNESKVQSESHFDEIQIEEQIETKIPSAKGSIVHQGHSSYSEGHIEKPEIKKGDTIEKIGEKIIDNIQPVFWISFNEVETFEYKVNILKHYGLRLIIARNKVEEEILKSMKDTDNVLHISDLIEDINIKGALTNTNLSKKEQKALMLLELISRILGFNHNIFSIGDLMVTKEVKIESLNVKNEIIEDSVTVLRNLGSEKVYIDRSIIDVSSLDENLDSKIGINDFKFILTNIYNIVEESYLICSKGNKNKENIMKDILFSLGQGKL